MSAPHQGAPQGSQSYPVDGHGFIRQCAWCRRIADEAGRYRVVVAELVAGATHGCCEACAIRFLSRGITPPRAA